MIRKIGAILILILIIASLFYVVWEVREGGFSLDSRWNTENRKAVQWILLMFLICWGGARIFCHRWQNLAVSGCCFLYIAVGVGILPMLAMLLFVYSCYANGLLVAGRVQKGILISEEAIWDGVLGLSIVVLVFSFLSLTRFNYAFVYLLLLGLPSVWVFWQQYHLGHLGVTRGLTKVRDSHAFWLCAIFCVFFVARYSFFPSINYDDSAIHLKTWTDLQINHTRVFDLSNQIWSVVPVTVDLMHAIVSVISGQDARPALNVMMFLLLVLQFHTLTARLPTGIIGRCIAIILFVSTPIFFMLLTSLQTELFFMLLVCVVASVICANDRSLATQHLMVLAGAFALLSSAKMTGTALSGFMILVLFLKYRVALIPPISALLHSKRNVALLVALFILSVYPYLLSDWLTGNPIFPLYNKIFQSPYFAKINFFDPAYDKVFSLHHVYGLFFDSGSYYESQNYIGGFQYFFVWPLALVVVSADSATKKYLWLLPICFFAPLIFSSVKYYRYLVPVFVLGAMYISAMIGALERVVPGLTRPLYMVLLGFSGINLMMAPGVSWYFNRSPESVLLPSGKRQFTQDLAPELLLNQLMNEKYPGQAVLFEPNRPYGATLGASPHYSNWYAPKMFDLVNNAKSSTNIANIVIGQRIDFVYTNFGFIWNAYRLHPTPLQIEENYKSLLTKYLADYGVPFTQIGAATVYKVNGKPLLYKQKFTFDEFNSQFLLSEEQKNFAKNKAILAVGKPARIIATFPVGKAHAMRYHAVIICPKNGAIYIAQVNWQSFGVYYRLVNCDRPVVDFVESAPIPDKATTGEIYIGQVDDGQPIVIQKLSVETE